MKLLQNATTVFLDPKVAWNYSNYWISKLRHSGQTIRIFPNGIKVTGFSGFSEFHSCEQYVSREESKFLQNYPFAPGDLIDIGANLGLITATLAKRFPNNRVHAFEPNPSTFQSLQATLALNSLTNVKTQQCAVGRDNGEVSFSADPIHRATCSIANPDVEHTISVPCTTLDSYLENQSINKIALLKVDVEGYETLVFQGAEAMIKHQTAQIIYYEVCPILTKKAGFDPKLPTQILLQNGYHIYKLNPQGSLVPIDLDSIHNLNLENWIAISKKID
ncbi:MAG: FkbM family methyltransferase [Coleofasciculaceae cyanobacterium]